MALSLQVSISDATTAQCSAPPSEPAKNAFLPIQRNRPDAALDDIGIDLDAAVVEEVGETVPTRERITDCLSEFGLLADQGELGAQPGFETINDRPAPVLADGAALVGVAAADVLLDGVEFGDAFECLGGNRRRTRGGEFVEAAADMGPAESKLHIVALGERPIARIAVDLQDTREAGEVSDRLRGLAIGRVHIGDAGRVGAAPRPIITRVGPQLADLGASAARIEHWRRGLVGEQLGRGLQAPSAGAREPAAA